MICRSSFNDFLRHSFVLTTLLLIPMPAASYEAGIEYVPARQYLKTTVREVDQAKESVKVYMFVITANLDEPDSSAVRLLNALASAKKRGVSVEVHLDQNVRFQGQAGDSEAAVEEKNKEAYQYLRNEGIPVYFDSPSNYTHSKVIIIDGKTTVFGSTNWSKSSIERNNETNALVRSERFAKEVLSDLSGVENLTPDIRESLKAVKIGRVFTTREDLMPKMVTDHDERAFDIYLYLLKEWGQNKQDHIMLDYDKLAKWLGIDGMGSTDYRKQTNKVLRKLQDEYKLITAQTELNKPAKIALKDLDKPEEVYHSPEEDYIEFPEAYWNYEWARRLSLAGKVMLLLNWQYLQTSNKYPRWSLAVEEIRRRHGLSTTFIGDGTLELRNLNLVDVLYQLANKPGARIATLASYRPEIIYDPEELEKRFRELAAQHGEDVVKRARDRATVVFKQNDYEDVQTLIGLEKEFGSEVVEQGVRVVANKRITNPKRKIAYLIGTIRRMGQP